MHNQKKTQSIYSEIKCCRLCNSTELNDVLDLGYQPPANSLRKSLNEELPTAPLKLVHCGSCSVVQLTATVDPSYLFSHYVWVTATSATARSYSETYCKEVLKRSEHANPFVVEIASNDGTFLKQFKSRGCETLGVDPAQNIAQKANEAGIDTWASFFDAGVAQRIIDKKRKPNIVMARNVIPHVKEIHSIVEGVSKLVESDGIAVVEFHYAKTIVDEIHYDSIYHEHLFYFSIRSLSALFKQYGMMPFDAFVSPISGGSIVLFFSGKDREQTDALKKIIEEEERSGLNTLATWQKFGSASKRHAAELKKVVAECAVSGKVVGYGASARSSTMMNFANISNKEVDCVIDRNPLKQNLYTPGTNIEIVSYEEGLRRLGNKQILLLAWNFEEEIVSDLRQSGYRGDIIVPLPNEIRVR